MNDSFLNGFFDATLPIPCLTEFSYQNTELLTPTVEFPMSFHESDEDAFEVLIKTYKLAQATFGNIQIWDVPSKSDIEKYILSCSQIPLQNEFFDEYRDEFPDIEKIFSNLENFRIARDVIEVKLLLQNWMYNPVTIGLIEIDLLKKDLTIILSVFESNDNWFTTREQKAISILRFILNPVQ
jgi:hypothetical protein